jgi:copper resistance protein B
MTPRTRLALIYGALGLMAVSFALGQESQDPAAHHDHNSSQAPEPQMPPAAAPDVDTASEAAHVPPDAPQHPMVYMPYHEMAAMMQMDDRQRTGMVLFDQLEWRNAAEGNAVAWDAEAWYGGDTNKVWLRSEGERVAGTTQNARADLLWDGRISAQARAAPGRRSASKDSRPIGSTPRRRSMSVSKGERP